MRSNILTAAVIALLAAGCASAQKTSPAPGLPSPTAASATSEASPSAAAPIDVSGLAGKILFTRAGGQYGEDTLFTALANGSSEKQIRYPTQVASWSPDGRWMSFEVDTKDGRLSVAIAQPDGTVLRTLPLPKTGSGLEAHAWSPDGKTIAFESLSDDPSLIGVYLGRSSDAGGLRRVGIVNDVVGGHAFSPDGTRLVLFRPSPSNDGTGSLYLVNADGSGLRQLTAKTEGITGAMGWSPDGRWILTCNVGAVPDGAIWLVGVDGSGMHKVFTPPPGHFVTSPAWSPDGSMIMFGLDDGPKEDAYDPNDLDVIRADGTGLAVVIGDETFKHDPDWVR